MRFTFDPKQSPLGTLGSREGTLLIPLAARALGATLHPSLDPQDRFAAQLLRQCSVKVQELEADPYTILNVLWRTQVIKAAGARFFQQHPRATGVNLGCGLSRHFQWFDNGQNRWIDADTARVIQVRHGLMNTGNAKERSHDSVADLRHARWWKAVSKNVPANEPIFFLLEGVLMYFDPQVVAKILTTIAENAPDGSQLLCDFISPVGVGHAHHNATMESAGAEFRWGAKGAGDLLAMHPGLRFMRQYTVSEVYGPLGLWIEWSFTPWTSGPLYAMAQFSLGKQQA